MKDYEREALLDKTTRETSFVGAEIPESIEVDGDTIPLKQYVFDIRTGGAREDRDAVKKKLRRKRSNLRKSLEEDDLSYEEGREVVERIAGIDRALTVLGGGEGSLDAEAGRQEKMDQQRWLEFLKKVTGRDDGGERR